MGKDGGEMAASGGGEGGGGGGGINNAAGSSALSFSPPVETTDAVAAVAAPSPRDDPSAVQAADGGGGGGGGGGESVTANKTGRRDGRGGGRDRRRNKRGGRGGGRVRGGGRSDKPGEGKGEGKDGEQGKDVAEVESGDGGGEGMGREVKENAAGSNGDRGRDRRRNRRGRGGRRGGRVKRGRGNDEGKVGGEGEIRDEGEAKDNAAESNENTETKNEKGGGSDGKGGKNDEKAKAKGSSGRVANSYLKIVMDGASLDRMHDMACAIRDEVKAEVERKLEEEARGAEIRKGDAEGTAIGADPSLGDNATSNEAPRDEATPNDMTAEPSDDVAASPDLNSGESPKRHDQQQQQQKLQQQQPPGESKQKRGRRPPRPISFKPRSRRSLHMTFFFGGTTLREIPPEDLTAWHGRVMGRLRRAKGLEVIGEGAAELNAGAGAAGSDDDGGSAPPTVPEYSGFVLTFKSLRLFPPRRNKLIVAEFEASESLHILRSDVRDIALSSECEELRNVVQRSEKRWTAHVTIGDVRGGTKGDVRELGVRLEEGLGLMSTVAGAGASAGTGGVEDEDDDGANCSFQARVRGVTMGGPVPEQAELDWDFFFFDEGADAVEK